MISYNIHPLLAAVGLSLVAGCSSMMCAADGTCTDGPGAGGAALKSPQKLRRLTRAEYDNTIHDLFGIESKWGAAFVPENVVQGWNNQADALTVVPVLAEQLRRAAEEIAAAVAKSPGLGSIAACAGQAVPAADCPATFVRALGERVLRRPLLDAEAARYVALYNAVSADGASVAFQTVIAALLQSPKFLYRTEVGRQAGGGQYALTPYEIASELSYFLWGSMPDAELFAQARSGALKDPAAIAAQARRMLKSPRARDTVRRFAGQWLNVDLLAVVPKDATVFPEFTPAIRAAMAEEAARYVSYVLFDAGGTYRDLLLGTTSFQNPELARFYGGPAPTGADASGFGQVDLTGSGRAGLLTLGAVVTANGRPNSSSPIQRGKLIRERLLCQQLPPPPPGINANPPALDPTLTTRARYAAHDKDPACFGCHKLIDKLGFAFEDFDGIGRHRLTENGMPLDLSGEVLSVDVPNPLFTGSKELATLLSQSAQAQRCYATQWLRFAYGVTEAAGLSDTVQQLGDQFAAGQRLDELLVALTQTEYFRVRAGDPAGAGIEDGTPAPPPVTPPPGGMDMGPPPPPATTLQVARKTQSSWGTGYCDDVTVTNTGAQAVNWEITLDVKGTINNAWNTTYSVVAAGQVKFAGANWNAQVQPGGSASFGFCAVL